MIFLIYIRSNISFWGHMPPMWDLVFIFLLLADSIFVGELINDEE
jgi:hypothetical protein